MPGVYDGQVRGRYGGQATGADGGQAPTSCRWCSTSWRRYWARVSTVKTDAVAAAARAGPTARRRTPANSVAGRVGGRRPARRRRGPGPARRSGPATAASSWSQSANSRGRPRPASLRTPVIEDAVRRGRGRRTPAATTRPARDGPRRPARPAGRTSHVAALAWTAAHLRRPHVAGVEPALRARALSTQVQSLVSGAMGVWLLAGRAATSSLIRPWCRSPAGRAARNPAEVHAILPSGGRLGMTSLSGNVRNVLTDYAGWIAVGAIVLVLLLALLIARPWRADGADTGGSPRRFGRRRPHRDHFRPEGAEQATREPAKQAAVSSTRPSSTTSRRSGPRSPRAAARPAGISRCGSRPRPRTPAPGRRTRPSSRA